MNIIIVTRNGCIDTPILLKNTNKANAVYEDLCRELLGDDFDDVFGGIINDYTYGNVNMYLAPQGISIYYFFDVEVQ
jgi:hypothetical protein